jgi:hypothetical protein
MAFLIERFLSIASISQPSGFELIWKQRNAYNDHCISKKNLMNLAAAQFKKITSLSD